MPNGVDTSPIAVAIPRSLSPNQLLASLETGFFKKAWLAAQIMCPANHIQTLVKIHIILITVPMIIIIEPIEMQVLRPYFSMTQIEEKFRGR